MSNTLPSIPAQFLESLAAETALDNREAIISHIISGEVTQLTDLQKLLYERWNMADNLMRSGRYTRREVASILAQKFSYSLASANRDIVNAIHVYNSTNTQDKKYLMAVHIDFIQKMVMRARDTGTLKDVAMMIREMTRAISMVPDQPDVSTKAPDIIINIMPADEKLVSAAETAAAEARRNAIDQFKQLFNITDIDFEEIVNHA